MADPTSPEIFSLRELAEILIRHKGVHDGIYEVSVHFQVAVGAVGPSESTVLPGAMIGVSGIGLVPAMAPGPNTVDAAIANPLRKTKAIRSKASASK
jgi:hypothetical protein